MSGDTSLDDPNTMSATVVVRMTPEMHSQLIRVAIHNDRTLSQTIRRAIRLYLEQGAP